MTDRHSLHLAIDRTRIDRTPILATALQNFKVKITDAGNDVYGEWRTGKHGDLVLAVALGCWAATDHRTGRVSVVSWEEAQAFSWR